MTTHDTNWTEETLKAPHTQRHIREISDKPSQVDIPTLMQMGKVARKYADDRD